MTALTDQIDNDLRDFNTPGNPGSGTYNFLMADLRDILNTMALATHLITEVGTFLNAADVNAARTAIGLGTGSSPTFTALTLSGGLTVDTTTFKVDATNNRVGVGTATPAVAFDVVGVVAMSSTLAVTGAVTFGADLTVDTSTLKVDSTNNRVGIATATPGVVFDVVGESRITANNATNGLRVVQTGVGNVVLFEDATSSDSSPWLIDQNGVVVHGYTTTITAEPSNVPKSQVHALGADAGYWATRWSADANPAYLRLGKSRGTAVGTRGTVSINDGLGSVLFLGDDGAAFRAAAEILVEADNTWGSSDAPGRIVFKTTADGSATPTEVLALLSNNFIAIGGDRDTGFFLPAANELAIYSGGGETARFTDGQALTIGHTDALGTYSGLPRVQVHGNNTSLASMGIFRESDDTGAGIFSFNKSRGSAGSMTVIQSGDVLGIITFVGYDGTGMVRGGFIQCETEGTIATGQIPSRMRFYVANTSGTLTEMFRIVSGNELRPGVDNSVSLGVSGGRWSVVYAATGSINTSDATEKNLIGGLSTEELEASKVMARAIKTFRWKDAVEKKGDEARIHVSPTAQAVAAAFTAQGLDPASYGMWCMDSIRDDDGNFIKMRQGIRPDQVALFMLAGLEQRVTALENA